ncbi:intermembrane lipid transfer protein VPS13B-like [Hyla sarda]|uniref:intermembrane lipid transfer protein VPS13B-like n=1 Tax=Hyla sarda TaxID=327740 RepID=UPI0024C3A3DA|nr:intermembrane lipid transfer protein VPS13B-like [Hyla sarda]
MATQSQVTASEVATLSEPCLMLLADITAPEEPSRRKRGHQAAVDDNYRVCFDAPLLLQTRDRLLCQFSISSMVRNGIQILQIEDKTVLINNTSMKIYYSPQMSVPQEHSDEEYVPVPDSTVFSIGPVGELPVAKYNTIPCWDLVSDNSHSTGEPPPLQKYMLLSLCHNAAAGSPDCWSLPAIVRLEYPRQSVAVPLELCAGNDLCTKALVLTYQEHFGVTYITLTEDPSPRVIIRNRCTVSLLLKENIKETPKFEVYCRKIPAECSVHHEMYHQVSSFPDCKTRDSLPGIYLKVLSCEESAVEWSDLIDINNQGTQVVFLTGYGYVYVDVIQHCGAIIITLAPEGRAGPVLTSLNRTQCQRIVFKSFITQLSVGIYDDVTNYKASSELMRLTMDNVFLHLTPVASYLRQPCQEMQTDLTCGIPVFYSLEVYCGDLQIDNQLYSKSNFHFPVLVCQEERIEFTRWPKAGSLFMSIKELEEYKETSFFKLFVTFSLEQDVCDLNELSFDLRPSRLYVEDTFVYYVKTLFDTYLPDNKTLESQVKFIGSKFPAILPDQVRQHATALVSPVKLRKLTVQPVNLLVSIHASLKLYIASDHTPLSFSMFERGPIFTTARQLIHALAMHYAAGALFRAGALSAASDTAFLGVAERSFYSCGNIAIRQSLAEGDWPE